MKRLLFFLLFLFIANSIFSQVDSRLFGTWFLNSSGYVLNITITPNGSIGNMNIVGSYMRYGVVKNVNITNAPIKNINSNTLATPSINIDWAVGQIKIGYFVNGSSLTIRNIDARSPNPNSYNYIIGLLDLGSAVFVRQMAPPPPYQPPPPEPQIYYGMYYASTYPYHYKRTVMVADTLGINISRNTLNIVGYIDFYGKNQINLTVGYRIENGRIITSKFGYRDFYGSLAINYSFSGSNKLIFGQVKALGSGSAIPVLQALTGINFQL